MGVNVSKRDLKKLLSDFNSDGELVLDMENFKGMVKKLMLECKVHECFCTKAFALACALLFP
jgi:hypothetical protein